MRRHVRTYSTIAVALLLLLLAWPAEAKKALRIDDPFYPRQWAHRQVRAADAWQRATGKGVVVALVGTGVDLSHPDLASRLLPGATFMTCSSPTPCGNGDWRSTGGEATSDPDPSGTHLAGIVAAATGNGTGIAGVAPSAKVLPVKVGDHDGERREDEAQGIRYAVDRGADVIHLGLLRIPDPAQGLDPPSAVADAITYALQRGVVVVAGAGDTATPRCEDAAGVDGVVCVTAVEVNELPSPDANHAVKADRLSLAAPAGRPFACVPTDDGGTVGGGGGVVSTWPVGYAGYCYGSSGYSEDGMSRVAAAHVAGVAALLVSQGRNQREVVDALTSTARVPFTGTRGSWSPRYGYGIVDAAAAVAFRR